MKRLTMLEDGKIYRFAESMDFTAVSTEYGPEICGADGTVTFKNVRRPAERQGFITIWSN